MYYLPRLIAFFAISLVLADSDIPSTDVLIGAIQQRDFTALGKALGAGADPNQPGAQGQLALIEAAKTKDKNMVELLLQYNALPNAKEPSTGITPVHIAFELEHMQIGLDLMKHGGDPEIKDNQGRKARDLIKRDSQLYQLVATLEEEGYEGFEDKPGSWSKRKTESGEEYYYHSVSEEARWTAPPSCSWKRFEIHGHPFNYINSITGQRLTRMPQALSWRKVILNKEPAWYNWKANHSQYEIPAELPSDMVEELSNETNVRWHNTATGDFSWEDPRHHTAWRTLVDTASAKEYYYNVLTSESTWEKPEELSWEELSHNDHNRSYFFNHNSGESQWEAPPHLAWQRHDSEL